MNKNDREDLDELVSFMVRIEMLDVFIREDGEWVYSPSAKALAMSDDEKYAYILKHCESE
jgi:hypothetical protein